MNFKSNIKKKKAYTNYQLVFKQVLSSGSMVTQIYTFIKFENIIINTNYDISEFHKIVII